jgi:Ser/Thr protein kinase RdoA (MazF antagonist)
VALRRAIGAVLGRFDTAFGSFRHPADDHPLTWDLKRTARLKPLLAGQGRDERALAEAALEAFALNVQPLLPGLRAQVIHNDLNLHNVLVDEASPPRVAGLIDFGDMIWAPLVNDLAIAMSYHVAGESDPLSGALELARAYHDRARMAMTVLIAGARARRNPQNADYITRNRPSAIAGLASLSRLSRTRAQDQVRRALGLGGAP